MANTRNSDAQPMVDSLVAAIHAGDLAATEAAASRLFQGIFEEGWPIWKEVQGGTLLRFDEIPSDPDNCYSDAGWTSLEEHVTADRWAEIQEGDGLSPQELLHLAKA